MLGEVATSTIDWSNASVSAVVGAVLGIGGTYGIYHLQGRRENARLIAEQQREDARLSEERRLAGHNSLAGLAWRTVQALQALLENIPPYQVVRRTVEDFQAELRGQAELYRLAGCAPVADRINKLLVEFAGVITFYGARLDVNRQLAQEAIDTGTRGYVGPTLAQVDALEKQLATSAIDELRWCVNQVLQQLATFPPGGVEAPDVKSPRYLDYDKELAGLQTPRATG